MPSGELDESTYCRSADLIRAFASAGNDTSDTSPIFSGNSRETWRMYLSCFMYRLQNEHMRKWIRSFIRIINESSLSIPSDKMRTTSGHVGVNRQMNSTI